MSYKSLQECISDLQNNGDVRIVSEQVDPNLDIASIHLDEFKNGKKTLLFENVRGTEYRSVSNLFGTLDRGKFIFRNTIEVVKDLIDLKLNPTNAFKNPIKSFFTILNGIYSIPKKVSFPKSFKEIQIKDLPQIKCWADDGGSFITLPQVYSEDIENPGVLNSNLGMYRIQLSGNDYIMNKEVGMHYQIHRGIGVHQKKAMKKGVPL